MRRMAAFTARTKAGGKSGDGVGSGSRPRVLLAMDSSRAKGGPLSLSTIAVAGVLRQRQQDVGVRDVRQREPAERPAAPGGADDEDPAGRLGVLVGVPGQGV